MGQKFESVDEYISSFPMETQTVLKKMREVIRRAVPGADEVISYGIPAFKVEGKSVIYFSGYKHHVSLYPRPTGDAAYQEAAEPFVAGKGTLQFPLDKPIPYDLIEQTATHLLQEQERQAKDSR